MSTAEQVLDSIARKYSGSALLREVVILDELVEAEVKESTEAWWQRHRERGNTTAPDDPFPEGVWTRRIDGLMFDGNQCRTAIEVKVSRADFLRETEEKRRAWRAVTHRFVYATPAGLLRPDEIPDGCGLWEVHPDGSVVIAKKARGNKTPDPIPQRVLVALAYRLKNAERSAA
ncbi:hypothetical protein GS500_04610 [Rhodococcus hoagii]|nr:hypothetical protein [Prescottella equi]